MAILVKLKRIVLHLNYGYLELKLDNNDFTQ